MARRPTQVEKRAQRARQAQPQPSRAAASSASAATGTHGSTPAFELVDIPGKGIGVVAARDLKAGDLVLKESPVLVLESATAAPALDMAYSRLSDQDRERYDALYISEPNEMLPRELAIFKTNAIGLGVGSSKGGVFLNGSRFNHACNANCHRAWDDKQGVEWFIAMVDIEAGTELTISYIEYKATRAARQLELQATFGFDCTCDACTLGREETAVSDERRLKIKAISRSTEYLRLVDPLKLVRDVKVAFSLMEEEGILEGRADLAFECLSVCAYNGDRLNTRLWTDKTLELDRRESGIWSSMYRQMKGWQGTPTRHPGWNFSASKSGTKVLIGPN
ncbi:hypothetical protein JCM11491_004973 [Sporobolomyces phaffii]